jgi:carboxyl-terminal processing protease
MDQIDPKISAAECIFVLAKVFQAVPRYFAHWESASLQQENLDQAFKTLTADTLACDEDRRCFSLQMMAFLALLNNGHTRFYDPFFSQLPSLGFTLRYLDNQWLITNAAIPGMRVGDAVQEIEGKPVEDWNMDLQAYATGSSQSRALQFGDWNSIFPPLLSLLLPERCTITYEDARSSTHTLELNRTGVEAKPAAAVEARWLEPGLAYLKVPSFLTPEFEARALACLSEFITATCLIVDVRGNGGGNTPRALLRALMNQPYRWWAEIGPQEKDRLANPNRPDQETSGGMIPQPPVNFRQTDPQADAYPGKLIILVDRATWSAAEDFVMPFKDNQRAVIIGETSGGSTGQPYFHSFENGMLFSIGARRVYWPDGAPFEGLGVQPDITISPRREDLYGGRDLVLQEAVHTAKNI